MFPTVPSPEMPPPERRLSHNSDSGINKQPPIEVPAVPQNSFLIPKEQPKPQISHPLENLPPLSIQELNKRLDDIEKFLDEQIEKLRKRGININFDPQTGIIA